MTDKENEFNIVDKNEMTLVQERIAWQTEHPKPWYLKQQTKLNKYSRQQTN